MRSYSLRIALASLLCLTLSSCSRDPNVRKQKLLASGQHYLHEGKYREASIEFINALQVDPQYAAAHYQLAMLYSEKESNPAAAIYHYQQFLKLRPTAD